MLLCCVCWGFSLFAVWFGLLSWCVFCSVVGVSGSIYFFFHVELLLSWRLSNVFFLGVVVG